MAGGRPTKLTAAVSREIVDAIATGVPSDTAAACAGVHPRTFYEWLAAGRKPDASKVHRQFAQAVTRARARAEATMLDVIRRHAVGFEVTESRAVRKANGATETSFIKREFKSWEAAAWILAHRNPRRWANRVYRIEPEEPARAEGPKRIRMPIEGPPETPTDAAPAPD